MTTKYRIARHHSELGVSVSVPGLTAMILLLLMLWPARARAGSFTEEEVVFQNGSVALAGTLILPEGQGPFPAIVFLHGSGPVTREGARPYAERFVELGIASLVFDKRGSGSSTGSWLTSSLDDLSNDALSAVRFLKAREEIDGGRIGLWGVSQAGWVATRAVAQSADVGFMILVSGGGASPRESELFSYLGAFQRAGLRTSEITEAILVLEAYFRYLASGEGLEALQAMLESPRVSQSRWYPHARLDRILPSPENRSNWSWVASWDPAPDIARISCPVLLLFGDQDWEQPTDIAVFRWREGLEEAGNPDFTIEVFEGAGHGIRLWGEAAHGSGRPPFAEGYFETMLDWLRAHVVSAGR